MILRKKLIILSAAFLALAAVFAFIPAITCSAADAVNTENIFLKSDKAHKYAEKIKGFKTETAAEKKSEKKTPGRVKTVTIPYYSLICKSAETNGIQGYERLIYAVMMAESGGRGTDVMGCSECPYNTEYSHSPNSITDVKYSIEVGTKYLAQCLKSAQCKSNNDVLNISLALQGYNYGNGYIEWAKKNYGGYSAANAIEFSEIMKAKLGWPRYGNPNYVSDVLKHYFVSKKSSQKFGSPFPGKNWESAVTSEYGYRNDPVTGEKGEFHTGIDIAYPKGTSISAIGSGKVEKTEYSDTGYGCHVVINHGNGIKTLYGHCSAICVKKGDKVEKGQIIAKVGSTGKSTGPHLHLNVYENGKTVNPIKYLKH